MPDLFGMNLQITLVELGLAQAIAALKLNCGDRQTVQGLWDQN
ncbi:MAG: hypothetical protein NT069_34305 [Planctomycetota bacterium]|nr:hypothetical protein [Planctomycetota bacterium]